MAGLAILATVLAAAAPTPASAAAPSPAARSAGVWQDVAGRPSATRNGAAPEISPRRFRALTLDRDPLADVLATAPRTRTAAARSSPLTISLPAPGGGMERFAIEASPVMEPALAARHPEIATYRGSAIDDPGATVALDLTPQGLHASVRGPGGSWYVDPYYHRDQSVYVSYRGADLVDDPHGEFAEAGVVRPPSSSAGRAETAAAPGDVVALHTYRLAFASDPAYAAYHGAANVTAAKASLINRINQVYENDLAIHLSLVGRQRPAELRHRSRDAPAQRSVRRGGVLQRDELRHLRRRHAGPDGRGHQPARSGSSNYDIGHLGMGVNGGGVAYLGVVGNTLKGGGCTGLTRPIGDRFAVDYVSHEMGHQFGAQHTFNGVNGVVRGQHRRGHGGRAGQRQHDHGLRGHLRRGQPAVAQRPVLLAAQHRPDQRLHRRRTESGGRELHDRQPLAARLGAGGVHDPHAHAVSPDRLGQRPRRQRADLSVGAERRRQRHGPHRPDEDDRAAV